LTRFLLLALALVSGCSSDRSGGAPMAPTPPPPGGPPPAPPTEDSFFRVAILVGDSRSPSDDLVTRAFAAAEPLLTGLTGERMTRVHTATVPPGMPLATARAFMDSGPDPQPDGVLGIFNDTTAVSFGGYSQSFAIAPPYRNRFPSPRGSGDVYLAVVDILHKYARCGYAADGETRIGPTSSGGECRNRSGLLCVDNGRYWQCPDSLGDLYSLGDRFAACTVVHEFMHPFGSEGNFDHYGTTQCTQRTGMSAAQATDLRRFQEHCGMCPDVYANFRRR
jgi:hypothetical protein